MATKDAEAGSEKIVIVIDSKNSTVILQELASDQMLEKYRDFMVEIRTSVEALCKTNSISCVSYKFLGDGWIFLLDSGITGKQLIEFFDWLAFAYFSSFSNHIIKNINIPIDNILGMTVGVDFGKLVKFQIENETEYVGKPLNFAARLQAKGKEQEMAFALVLSNKVYSTYLSKALDEIGVKVNEQKLELKNFNNQKPVPGYTLNMLEISSNKSNKKNKPTSQASQSSDGKS